jgi:hypothetical protein
MTRTATLLIAGFALAGLVLLARLSLAAGPAGGTDAAVRQARQQAPDAVKVDPKHYTVELENDRVRVVRISYGPHEKSVMHGHRAGIGVFLTDSHFKFTYPDGKTEEINGAKGKFLWFGKAWSHLPENLSDAPFEAVYIELKR